MTSDNNGPNGARRATEVPPRLAPADQEQLRRLEDRLQLVRDRTRAVALGHSTGFYLFGNGGIGKSYSVKRELDDLQANYVLFNSRMTGKGLFNALEKFPDAVHLLEDMEQIMCDRGAQGVLRSALWGQRREGDQGPMERVVTWSTHIKPHSFLFTGGIVMLSNVPLHNLPQLDAVKTRIAYMHLQASDAEVRALMRSVASRGYESAGRRLEPDACVEVCEFVIAQSVAVQRSLDMRLLVTSFEDRLMWEEGQSRCHWRDLVGSRVRERQTHFREPVDTVPAVVKRQRQVEIAREIAATGADTREQHRLWTERTDKSVPTFYRRLKEPGV